MFPFLSNPISATFAAHLFLLDIVTRVVFHDEHKTHISLGNSLQLPVAPSTPIIGPNSLNLFSSFQVIIQVPRPLQIRRENNLKVYLSEVQ